MAPKTKEQYAKIREERREEILNISLELFAKNGISETTMQDIANEVGISKGLIYNYFSGKEELLDEIVKSFVAELYDYFDADGDGILTSEEMKFFLEKQVGNLEQHPGHWKFLFMLLMQPKAHEMMHRIQLEVFSSKMWQMVRSYFETHRFDDPEGETWLFHAILDGVALNYVFSPDTFPINQVMELVIRRYCKPTLKPEE